MRSGRGAAALDPPQMTRRRRPGSQLQAFGLTTSCCWSPAEITIGRHAAATLSNRKLSAEVYGGGADQKRISSASKKHHRQEV
jgi:hypothetical protein